MQINFLIWNPIDQEKKKPSKSTVCGFARSHQQKAILFTGGRSISSGSSCSVEYRSENGE